MTIQLPTNTLSSPGQTRGFTLVEALVSLVLLAIVATTLPPVYQMGLQAAAAQQQQLQLTTALANQMEALLSTDFSALQSGSSQATIAGRVYTLIWTISQPDLNGDSVPETSLKQLDLHIPTTTLSLTTLVYDSTGQLEPY